MNFVRHLLLEAEKHAHSVLPSRPEFWLQGMAIFVNAALVVALAYTLAGLTVAILWNQPLLSVGTTALVQSGVSTSEASSQATNYTAIGEWHLFGQVETAQPVAAPPPVQAVTPLNLRLVGVFFIQDSRGRALALIAEGNSVEKGYRVGAALPGGAQLEAIQRDRVVVSRNGQQETLSLPTLDSVRKTSASSAASTEMPSPEMPPLDMLSPEMPQPEMPLPPEMPQPEMPPPPEVPQPEMSPQSGVSPSPTSDQEQAAIDARAVASRMRDAVSGRPQALEDIAFASPYVRDGQFLGFRLRPGRDRQLMQQLGLNSGDVLTEVNGSRLNSPLQGLALLQGLLNAEQVNVRVLRDGTEIPLTFSLGPPTME